MDQVFSFESWEAYEAFKAALPEGLTQGEYEAMIRVVMAIWTLTATVDDRGQEPDAEAVKGTAECVSAILEGLGKVLDISLTRAKQERLEGFR